MRIAPRLVACAVLLGFAFAAGPARALGSSNEGAGPVEKWAVSVGALFPMDDVCGISADTGFSVAAGHILGRTERGYWLGSLRYSRYGLACGDDIELITPELEYQMPLGSDNRFYWGPGVGVVFAHNTGGGSRWNFAYSVAAGANFGRMFAELRLQRGTTEGEHGVILSGGMRF